MTSDQTYFRQSSSAFYRKVRGLGGNNLDQSAANPAAGDDPGGAQHPQPGEQHEHPPRALRRPQRAARPTRQELIRHREAATSGEYM